MQAYRRLTLITLALLTLSLPRSAIVSQAVGAEVLAAFSDVSSTVGYGPSVLFVADNGWVSGYTDVPGNTPCANAGRNSPCFLPDFGSTRAQVSKMIVNAKVAEGTIIQNPSVNTFQDVPVGSTFYVYIETMYYYGWISGYNCGGPGEPCIPPNNKNYFRPYNTTTRSQFAKMLVNAMNQIRTRITPATPTFSDVPTTNPFYVYVETAWSHFAILDNGVYYTNYIFRAGDSIARGDVTQALFHTTALERGFGHNGLYAGSNNWDGPNTNCNPVQTQGQVTFLSGVELGFSTDYGGYTKYMTIAREIQFDPDSISFLGCQANYKLAIVLHAFDNPGGSGHCQNGVYTANASDAYTNLPRPVESRTQPACFPFVDNNEDRILTDSPNALVANAAQYFAMTEWHPSGPSPARGEMNVDNYELDSGYNTITGRKDNMQKYCYERGNNGGGYPQNKYGVFPCP